jgi:glycerophosphoryl diester phosphodiesterase
MCVFKVEQYVDRKLPTVCIAHRGFSGRYPQSTGLAFEKAIEVGASVVEFDVRLTSDGGLVVFHDPHLMRFCKNGRNMPIEEVPLSQLMSVDMGMNQSILSFEQVLELLAGRVGMNIHIKDESICDRVVGMCKSAGVLAEVFFAISWIDSIRQIQKKYPDAWICSLYHRETEDLVKVNANLGLRIIQPTTDAFAGGAAEKIISEARSLGVVLNIFYADYYSHFMWLKKLGIDGILTNFPDQMLACFADRKKKTVLSKNHAAEVLV